MYNIFNFIIYSILGFLVEVIFKFSLDFHSHSGILFGPYCPVYGFGLMAIFIVYGFIEKKFMFKTLTKISLFLLVAFILLSLFEFIGGNLIELTTHKVFWDYTEYPLNLGKYVTIEMSLLWSIGAVLIYTFIKPITDKLYFKTNKKIIITFFIIMIIDFIITLISKIK